MTCGPVPEFVKNSITIGLLHFGVDIEARISKLCDLLGKKFHSINRVAKNNTLIDVKLGKKGIEAVNFLSLVNKRVELCNAPKSQLLHKIYNVPKIKKPNKTDQ